MLFTLIGMAGLYFVLGLLFLYLVGREILHGPELAASRASDMNRERGRAWLKCGSRFSRSR